MKTKIEIIKNGYVVDPADIKKYYPTLAHIPECKLVQEFHEQDGRKLTTFKIILPSDKKNETA